MKYACLLVMLLLVLSSLPIHSQNTFQYTISSPDDQVINQTIENNDGGFVLVGRIYHSETGKPGGYIIEIDSVGNVLKEDVLQKDDTISYKLYNIHFVNNKYYLLGNQTILNPGNFKLWYVKLNLDLEIEDEKILNIPSNRWIVYMNSILDSDSNFVLTGYTSRIDTNLNGNISYNNDAYYYKLNLSGDSLTSHFYTNDYPINTAFDIIESQDCLKYYSYVSHFTNYFGTPGQKLILNKNLDSLSIDSIPLEIFDFYSPTYINPNKILICGSRLAEPPDDYALNVITTTEAGTLIDYNTFKRDSFRDHPAMYQGVSINNTNIYVGGTSNLDYANPFFSTFDSWFHLIKVNPDLSPVWENWYGGDAYYFLYSILATSDGGCLMVGNRYDYEVQEQERDIYVVKVNSDGLIVWTQEIDPGQAMFSIYPNPGKDLIQIKMPSGEFEFELIGLNGQILIRQQVSNQMNLIITSHLKAGIYFYRITDQRNQIISSGKWIKN
jgi:hypothetical protein